MDVWKDDDNKTKIANVHGFVVMSIWESDYKADKIGTLQKALDFLKSENNIEKEFNENFKPS